MQGCIHLVTGATGHIGNVLVRKLIERGEKVRALLLPGENRQPIEGLDVEIAEGNVLDPPALQRAMQGVDTVYHLAGVISIMPGRNRVVREVNVQGTANVLDAVARSGVRRLVYTSSIHAIQRAPHGVVIDEQVPFDPQHAISAYDRSKAEASLLVQQAARQGLDAVITCPTGVIGPYDYRGSEMGHVIRDVMEHTTQLVIDGAYDFVDVRDVADGILMAGEKGRSGESYILSGERLSLGGLVDLVQSVTGRVYRRIHVPTGLARFAALFGPLYYRLAHTRPRLTPYAIATITSNSFISNARAHSELGYTPRSLRESIRDTLAWLSEHRLEGAIA